jgi:hypothetical protein
LRALFRSEPQSSEEPYGLELRRAREHGRGRHAIHPMDIPWRGWYDILWRAYREMQSNRLLSIARGVSFFAFSRLSRHHGARVGLRAVLRPFVARERCGARNVLGIVHEQANRIVAISGRVLVSLWSAMGGIKAVIDVICCAAGDTRSECQCVDMAWRRTRYREHSVRGRSPRLICRSLACRAAPTESA